MLTILHFAAVPASLLLFIATHARSTLNDPLPWAPQQIHSVYPDAHFETKAQSHSPLKKWTTEGKPVAVLKMSDNEGEMFFPQYWQFLSEKQDIKDARRLRSKDPWIPLDIEPYLSNQPTNASTTQPLHAPFSLHTEQTLSDHLVLGRLPRALFPVQKREFHCPTDTVACDSISRPNSCCPTGDTCQLITDTGQGDVGCCPQGQGCSGQVSQCEQGYQSCPGSAGGGCCIPGYACAGIGCVLASTSTVIVNPTVTASPTYTSTLNVSSKVPAPSTTTTIVPAIILTTTASSFSTTSTSSTLVSTSSPAATTSALVNAPVRPTSLSTDTITTTSSATSSPSTCPTGFYQCLAFYHGGCCRVGRDCGLTDCPSSASTTIADTNGVTIVAPTGNAIGTATPGLGKGSCATGWSSCAASLGGGCCPGGYGCVTGTTCTATIAGEIPTGVAKEPTSEAKRLANSWGAIVAAVAMSLFFLI